MMAEPLCRTCYDNGIIFDKNDLALPCPVCDAWMEPEPTVVERNKRKPKTKKKAPAAPPPSEAAFESGDFFDDLYGLHDDDPTTWGSWWDDDAYELTPMRPVDKSKGKNKKKKKKNEFGVRDYTPWWDDPTDPFGPERSEKGRNPRPIQNPSSGSGGLGRFKPTLPAAHYVKDVAEREKPEVDWFEYDTRWFNDDLNNHVLHTVRKLTDAYPVTKNWFRGIRVSDVPPTACVVPNDRKIWLTPSFLDKPNTNGFKRPQFDDDRLDRLIAHEFGHVLHASILADSVGEHALPDLDMNDLLSRNYTSDSLSHPDSPATYIVEEGKKKVRDTYITGYAETDELERFAEAMTEHWTSHKPPELASFVGKGIDFLYHKDRGLNRADDYQSWWDSTMQSKEEGEDYENFWRDETGDDYKDWWIDEKRKQQTETAEKADYQRWWDDGRKTSTGVTQNQNIMEFISDPTKEPRSYMMKRYKKWWEDITGRQYEDWWGEAVEGEKKASRMPDVLYFVAPMKRRAFILNTGIKPTIVLSNESDAQMMAQQNSEKEPQDIYYIDPSGLSIAPTDGGWKVSSVTADNILQIEGWDPERFS